MAKPLVSDDLWAVVEPWEYFPQEMGCCGMTLWCWRRDFLTIVRRRSAMTIRHVDDARRGGGSEAGRRE